MVQSVCTELALLILLCMPALNKSLIDSRHVFGPQSVHLNVQHNQQPAHETMAETMARQRAEREAARGKSASA